MKFSSLLISVGLFVISSLCLSQESDIKIGLGVSLNPTALLNSSTSATIFLPIGFTNIYAPITFQQKYRIEPEAGIYSQSSTVKSGALLSNSSSTLVRLGIGVLKIQSYEDTFNAYYGSRIGILLVSSTSTYTGSPDASAKETDYYIGFVAGGEHMLSQHFGIGGEIQINYVDFGNPVRTPTPSTSSERDQSVITNNALMFFRWYY